MKISEVITKLQNIQDTDGDVEVMLESWSGPEGPFLANYVIAREVEDDDDYPEDWDMPKGFKYAEIGN